MTGPLARYTGDPLRLALLAIGAVTVLSGLAQMLVPGFVLRLLSADAGAASGHLFATVGMFMVVVGGLLVHALTSADPPAYVLLWAGLQKFGAFALVSLGVARDLFGPLALLVAVFDLATSGLCALMWWRLARRAAAMRVTEALA